MTIEAKEKKALYKQISADEIPRGVRFAVPARLASRQDAPAFGGLPGTAPEVGAPFKRDVDPRTGAERFFRLVGYRA